MKLTINKIIMSINSLMVLSHCAFFTRVRRASSVTRVRRAFDARETRVSRACDARHHR